MLFKISYAIKEELIHSAKLNSQEAMRNGMA